MPDVTFAIAGNPNCGKTTLFNALTGGRQRVGNWPGVTVERKESRYRHNDVAYTVVDLPGIYSLDVISDGTSLDEKIARDYLLSGEPDLIVNIIDASNLERNLYLTVQLMEMRLPLVLALNMMDIAQDRGVRIAPAVLAQKLGCPVIPLVASKGQGLEALKDMVAHAAAERQVPTVIVPYRPVVEDVIHDLTTSLEARLSHTSVDARWVAVKLLEGDELAQQLAGDGLQTLLPTQVERIETVVREDIDTIFADSRYGFVNTLTQDAVAAGTRAARNLSDKIDRVVLHRMLGIPIFLVLMYLMFMRTINVGSAFIDFFDILVGTLLVDGFRTLLTLVSSPAWLTTLLADGVGGGLQIVATFIPILGFLFLCLAVLEDSGYMARAYRFTPCWRRPSSPSGLRTSYLPYTSLASPWRSSLGWSSNTPCCRGGASTFVMELPPYHLPTWNGLVLRTWERLKTFLCRAGQVIVLIVVLLSFLNSLGTDGSFGHQNRETSMLSTLSRFVSPLFAPMGLREDNWPALVGIVTGVFAKEAVVGTLDALYTELATSDTVAAHAEAAAFDLWGGVRAAFASIPTNLADVTHTLLDPLGISVGEVRDLSAAAESQAVQLGTFGTMVNRFDGRVGAFAYLLFILLYFPCVAATAAVYRETNTAWTVFIAAWTTGLAYYVAVTFYQVARFAQHPMSSALWVVGLTALLLSAVLLMRVVGRNPMHRWSLVRQTTAPVLSTQRK